MLLVFCALPPSARSRQCVPQPWLCRQAWPVCTLQRPPWKSWHLSIWTAKATPDPVKGVENASLTSTAPSLSFACTKAPEGLLMMASCTSVAWPFFGPPAWKRGYSTRTSTPPSDTPLGAVSDTVTVRPVGVTVPLQVVEGYSASARLRPAARAESDTQVGSGLHAPTASP